MSVWGTWEVSWNTLVWFYTTHQLELIGRHHREWSSKVTTKLQLENMVTPYSVRLPALERALLMEKNVDMYAPLSAHTATALIKDWIKFILRMLSKLPRQSHSSNAPAA